MADDDGLPVKLVIKRDQTHDIETAAELLGDIRKGKMVLAGRAYDANWLHDLVLAQGGCVNIPPNSNRPSTTSLSPKLNKQRNLVERFLNKFKYYCRIATRYDRSGSPFLAMVKLARIRLRLRHYESTAECFAVAGKLIRRCLHLQSCFLSNPVSRVKSAMNSFKARASGRRTLRSWRKQSSACKVAISCFRKQF